MTHPHFESRSSELGVCRLTPEAEQAALRRAKPSRGLRWTAGKDFADFARLQTAEGLVCGNDISTPHRSSDEPEDYLPLTLDLVFANRRGILTMAEDTSRGDHDTLIAACDGERYILLGAREYRDNCTGKLFAAIRAPRLTPPECPTPLNLFMNIPWTPSGGLSFEPPTTRPGDHVTLRAELDRIVAMSACAQDILPINGRAGRATEAHFEILG